MPKGVPNKRYMADFYEFTCAIQDPSGEKLKNLQKSDLHNHAARGGKVSYLKEQYHIDIPLFEVRFQSIDSMDLWFRENIQCKLPRGVENYLKRVEANFVAAREDHIGILALDFGIGEIYEMGGMDRFTEIITNLNHVYAPDTKLLPFLVIREMRGLEYLEDIFSYNWFKGIDIINYKNEISMEVLQLVCELAGSNGLKCRAHVGEFGRAEDVWNYVMNLPLDEIQHGIQLVNNEKILRGISDRNLVFHVCPASNIRLGLCADYKSHPIRKMIDYGLKVTVNTDDQLLFGASVSDEYRNLYTSGVLNEEELYRVYRTGMELYQEE